MSAVEAATGLELGTAGLSLVRLGDLSNLCPLGAPVTQSSLPAGDDSQHQAADCWRAHEGLTNSLLDNGVASLDTLRIDSTVVASHIAAPSDSQLLNDGVRVISRLLAKSQAQTGPKVRFKDKRKASRSLAFAIFNAKKPPRRRCIRIS